jgi:hypothetical protein
MAPGQATLIVDKHRVPIRLDTIAPASVRVTPEATGALASELSSALAAAVDVGPLPYGLRLTGIEIVADAAVVTARAGKGKESI